MHLIDSLAIGGAEQVAVNLANLLPRDRFRSHLCTTRREGPLAELVRNDVGRLCLQRNRTLDWIAVRRLVAYIRRHDICIVHAHGYALLIAVVAKFFCRPLEIVWHVHYGQHAEREPWGSAGSTVC